MSRSTAPGEHGEVAIGTELGPLDVEGIQRVLPHRAPFLLIDRIVEHQFGKRTVGLKNVTVNEALQLGQDPKHPIMPPSLTLEAIAQTGAVLLLSLPQNVGREVYLCGLDDVNFYQPARIGDQLVCEAIALRQKKNIGQMKGRAFVDGKLVAEGMYWFALSE